jgi:hypothetical protein
MKEYSVTRFINEDLHTTTYAFLKKMHLSRQLVSNWKTRRKSVGSLPIQILIDFVAESGLSYEQVIDKLMRYEIDFEAQENHLDL